MTNNVWQNKKLAEVAEINPSKRAVSSFSLDTPVSFVSMASINENIGTISNIQTKKLGEVNNGYTYFSERDVLLAKITPCMENGKVAIAQNLTNGIGFGTTEIYVIRPNQNVLPEWIYSCVNNDSFRNDAKNHMTGSGGQQRVPREYLENTNIPVPPLYIQQQIVEKLDTIKKLLELNQKEIEQAEELFNSYLARAFKSPNEGITKRLGKLFVRSSKTILPVTLGDKLINYIGLENIESNTGRLVSFSKSTARKIKSTKTQFRRGEILYGKLRPYLNKVWFATMDGICSTDIWVLKAQETEILLELLPILLRLPEIVKKTLAGMTGTSLPRVNPKIFDNIEVNILPIEKQKAVLEEVIAIQSYQQLLQAKKEKLLELFDSALNKLMKPNYEK